MEKWVCKRCSGTKPSSKKIMDIPFCGTCGKYLMTPAEEEPTPPKKKDS